MIPLCIYATWCRQMTHFSLPRMKRLNWKFWFWWIDCNFKCLMLKAFSECSILKLSFVLIALWLQQAFHISPQLVHEFNHYITVMVNCLWNSKMFLNNNLGVKIDEELLLRSKVPQGEARFSFIHHPAFLSFAIDFHHRVGDCLLCCTHACSLIKVQLLLIWLSEQRGVGLQKGFVINQGDKCDVNVSFIGDTLIQ